MSVDPLSAFHAMADAIGREDWRAAASLCDPASLTRFKRRMLDQLGSAASRRLTVEQYLRHQPDIPLEVAEHQVANHNRWADPARRIADELPGIGGIDELRERSALELFASWLEGRSPGHQLRRVVAAGELPAEVTAGLHQADFPRPVYVALGAIADGANVSHVVFRAEFHGGESAEDADGPSLREGLSPEESALEEELIGREHPQIATCRRQPDGEWRMLAGENLLGLGSRGIAVGLEDAGTGDPDELS